MVLIACNLLNGAPVMIADADLQSDAHMMLNSFISKEAVGE